MLIRQDWQTGEAARGGQRVSTGAPTLATTLDLQLVSVRSTIVNWTGQAGDIAIGLPIDGLPVILELSGKTQLRYACDALPSLRAV